MAGHFICRLVSMSCVVAMLIMTGCQPKIKGKPVSLEPNDPRPIFSVQVADADEATLLVQKLGLEIVRMEGLTVYFFKDANQLPRLVDLGYDLKQQNSYDVFRRVVRIDRTIPETELVTDGVRIINREKTYLIVDATIGQLRALERSGSKIVAIMGHEPRPRQVRIVVESMEDVGKIGAMAVDIYSAKSEVKDSIDAPRRIESTIVIYGGAFDYQIDRLKDMGYSVKILPEPAPIKKGDNHEKVD